ncbi:MAG: Uncharacterised protein [Formosa sp. Hel1_33_131]|nr:MAG: Uncharacterised protein [Formosa sp. Hel1_33_131]
MKIIACIILLTGYGFLTRFCYKDKKYVASVLWALIFIIIVYLMIDIYIDAY